MPPSQSDLDHLLTLQFAVAWAGEAGEEPRLGWWRTDMVSEDGGADFFQRVAPASWRWAVLQAAREAARRADAAGRARLDDADRAFTLYFQGFELDERVEERLGELKRTGGAPEKLLPGLAKVVAARWDRPAFEAWIATKGAPPAANATAAGRRIDGAAPSGIVLRADKLVAALAPLGTHYPLPYFRRAA